MLNVDFSRVRNGLSGKFLAVVVASLFGLGLLSGISEAAKKASKKTSAASPKKLKSEKKKKTKETASNEPDEAFYENTWRLFELGSEPDKKKAVSDLKGTLKKDPGDALAHYYLGIMLSENGPAAQAEEHLRAALTAYPDSTDILFRLGELLSGKKDTQVESLGLYEKVLVLNPQHAGALSAMGLKALAERKFDKAIELLSRAAAADSENRETFKGLGKAYVEANQPANAIDVLKRALVFDATDGEAYLVLGRAYEALGNAKEAAEVFKKAESLGTKVINVKGLVGYALARALYQTGKIEDAISEYQKAIKNASDPATGWFEIGKIRESQGDPDKAISALKKAFELDRKLEEAVFMIGKIERGRKMPDDAIAAFEIIAKKKTGWGDRAAQEIEEIKAEKSEDEHDRLVELAGESSEKVKEKALLDILAKDKKDEFALRGMKELCLAQGDSDKAKYYMKQLEKYDYVDIKDSRVEQQHIDYAHESGDDLSEIENRVEAAKRAGNLAEAGKYQNKLIEAAQKWKSYWESYKPKTPAQAEEKKEGIKNAKWRVKSLQQDLHDINRQKKGGDTSANSQFKIGNDGVDEEFKPRLKKSH